MHCFSMKTFSSIFGRCYILFCRPWTFLKYTLRMYLFLWHKAMMFCFHRTKNIANFAAEPLPSPECGTRCARWTPVSSSGTDPTPLHLVCKIFPGYNPETPGPEIGHVVLVFFFPFVSFFSLPYFFFLSLLLLSSFFSSFFFITITVIKWTVENVKKQKYETSS